jgi:hypothetical protein
MVEEDDVITGTSDQLSFRGVRHGSQVSVTFQRAGSSGTFFWTVQADGSLAGAFTDTAAANSGTEHTRTRAVAALAVPPATAVLAHRACSRPRLTRKR